MSEDEQLNYAVAEDREKYRLAAESPAKMDVVRFLVNRHRDDQILDHRPIPRSTAHTGRRVTGSHDYGQDSQQTTRKAL